MKTNEQVRKDLIEDIKKWVKDNEEEVDSGMWLYREALLVYLDKLEKYI